MNPGKERSKSASSDSSGPFRATTRSKSIYGDLLFFTLPFCSIRDGYPLSFHAASKSHKGTKILCPEINNRFERLQHGLNRLD